MIYKNEEITNPSIQGNRAFWEGPKRERVIAHRCGHPSSPCCKKTTEQKWEEALKRRKEGEIIARRRKQTLSRQTKKFRQTAFA